jgi:hypothetical protein
VKAGGCEGTGRQHVMQTNTCGHVEDTGETTWVAAAVRMKQLTAVSCGPAQQCTCSTPAATVSASLPGWCTPHLGQLVLHQHRGHCCVAAARCHEGLAAVGAAAAGGGSLGLQLYDGHLCSIDDEEALVLPSANQARRLIHHLLHKQGPAQHGQQVHAGVWVSYMCHTCVGVGVLKALRVAARNSLQRLQVTGAGARADALCPCYAATAAMQTPTVLLSAAAAVPVRSPGRGCTPWWQPCCWSSSTAVLMGCAGQLTCGLLCVALAHSFALARPAAAGFLHSELCLSV